MSCEDTTADLLRKAGHKMTPQRMLIVNALRHAHGHMTAAQIAEQVRETYPFVDVSTVYRTLDVLKRMRLATVIDIGQGDVVFEWLSGEPHHHLICHVCRGLQEIPHEPIQQLGADIEARNGFVPDMVHFAIFGTCRECRQAAAKG